VLAGVNPSSRRGANGRRVRRALLIVNPVARRAGRAGEKAVRAFVEEGVSCEVIFTGAAGHATELARERGPKVDAVFTLGGDGTAMEVITALADSSPPVGVLPGGTGNVLARALGIPMSVRSAVHALVEGHEARLDLGRLRDGRHFAIGLGVGLDEAMIAGTSPLMKRHVGVLAYVWSAFKAAMGLRTFRARLTVDGRVHERDAAFVLIANLGAVPMLGGVLRFGDGILHDDGVLHACLFSPRSRWAALRLFVRLMRGTAQSDPSSFYVPGREFRLETDPPRRTQADGELLDMTPVEISVRPGAARLLMPRATDPRSSSRPGGMRGR
jgi:diacylglycerol kinase (ATP)